MKKATEVYVGLYVCRDMAASSFGVKIGHSQNSTERVGNLMVPYDLQDLIWKSYPSNGEARKSESFLNHQVVTKIYNSGGSGEMHVIPRKYFARVYRLLKTQLGEGKEIGYQAHARAVSNRVLSEDMFPTNSRLKKNYVA
jgi:hypothetical protein